MSESIAREIRAFASLPGIPFEAHPVNNRVRLVLSLFGICNKCEFSLDRCHFASRLFGIQKAAGSQTSPKLGSTER